MSAAESLAKLIRRRYDECAPGRWPMEDSLAEFILEHAAEVRLAVVELPEPCGTDDDGQVFFGEWDIRADPTGSLRYRGVTTDFGLGSEFKRTMSPAVARWWGEHLLAAAEAVGS